MPDQDNPLNILLISKQNYQQWLAVHALKENTMDDTLADSRVEKKTRVGNDKQRVCKIGFKKNECKPWLKRMWCIQEITEEYRTRMYRLLKLYKQGHDPSQPLVCMDEKSKQLLLSLIHISEP